MSALRETIETVDGTQYWSDDNWQTIWWVTPKKQQVRKVTGQRADRVRFLAIHKYGGGRDD